MYEYRYHHDAQSFRVGDRERDQTGDVLRRAHAEGRLDAEEFQERIERCYKAKTASELSDLVADLPGEQRRRERHFGRPPWAMPRWRAVLGALLAIFLVGAVIHGHALCALLPLFILTLFWRWRRRPYFRL